MGREACWLVFSLSFFAILDSPIYAPAWSPFPLIPRIEGFSAGPASNVHGWCDVVPLDLTSNDDKTGVVRHCQPQESQSTDTMVHVGVKAPLQEHLRVGVQLCGSADARGLGAGTAFATARGFLGNDSSNDQAEYFALSSVFASGLFDSCQTARTSSPLGLSF